jgi:hypothetical protein
MTGRMSSRIILKIFLIIVVCSLFFVSGRVSADQPHMRAALNALRNARNELQIASANKGGHRAKAIDLVNQAITQVEKGIAYAQ